MFLLVTDAQPGSPHGRCAIKPRSAGDFYVGHHASSVTDALSSVHQRGTFNELKSISYERSGYRFCCFLNHGRSGSR